ncbi:MAG: hypothetical protein WC539_04740 [Nitrospirota bacterium]
MDGIFRTDPPRIEEIKTGFNIHELAERLASHSLNHPYCLQLATYGYFFWLEQKIIPLDGAEEADIVICDYNYVFAPRSVFNRIAMIDSDQPGRTNLVIDEIHNLPSRAMDYYSLSFSGIVLEQMRNNIHAVPLRFRGEAEALLDECIQVLPSCGRGGLTPKKITLPVDLFLEQDSKVITAYFKVQFFYIISLTPSLENGILYQSVEEFPDNF